MTPDCDLFVFSPFIQALFPENLDAEKRGRPTTASSKIKVSEIQLKKDQQVRSPSGPDPKTPRQKIQFEEFVFIRWCFQ